MCTKQFAGLLAPVLLALVVSCAREAEDIPGNSGGATGTGCDPSADDENGDWSVDQAKQFCKFQLYWLGEEYEGLPLTKIERHISTVPTRVPSYEAEDILLFVYGSCQAKPDSGCPEPVSVRVEPYCS